MSEASSILSFCEKIKRKWKSSSCKTFDKFNLWLWLILWPSSPWERCRKPVQELAQDQFIRNLPRWRPLRVDFSLFSHRFPTWKMHSTPGCTWKMQLMQKTPKTGHLRRSSPAKATGQLKSFDLGFCQQVPAYFYSYRILYVLFFLSGCIHFNHDLL